MLLHADIFGENQHLIDPEGDNELYACFTRKRKLIVGTVLILFLIAALVGVFASRSVPKIMGKKLIYLKRC